MRIFKKTLLFILPVLLAYVLTACDDGHNDDYEAFMIKVDSIQLPESVNANESFDIVFFGTVGTNGCYQFSDFKTSISENEIVAEVWGTFNKKSDICTMAIVMLNGEKLNYTINETGTYTFKVKQPDGTYIEKQVTVV